MKGDIIMKTNKWFWGLFFICAAAAIILNALGYLANVGMWSIIFTIVLIPIFVGSLLNRVFAGIFFPLALIGILFAQPLGIQAITPWPLLVAALFLSIAFSIMFRKKRKISNLFVHSKEGEKSQDDVVSFKETIEYVDDNEVDCSVSFGACTKYIHCAALRKADLNCSFGEIKIFFDKTQLDPDGAVIDVNRSFGSIEIYVPKSWRIQNNITTMIGAAEAKNDHSDTGSGPLVTLTGRVSFGSVEIIYV